MSSAPTKAVFLSYASQDADAARKIADALRAAAIEVWFDQSELRGGDAWDAKIRKQIKGCALFVPIISANTQARREGYFRLEWRLADQRTHLMGKTGAFIVPVCIDDTPDRNADVPDSFLTVQWTRLSGGSPHTGFAQNVRALLTDSVVAPASSRPVDETGRIPALRRRSARSPWLISAIGAIAVVGTVAIWRPWKSSPATPAAPPTAAVAAPAISDKSIAVLPFENRSAEQDSAFFTDGVHEDILTNLALVRELRVVSRTSVAQYRSTTKSMRQIGQELGVAYLLEGSVQRASGKVRVTGQLIDARTDRHVWAQTYDKDLTDVFAIQSELAQAIARELKTVLSPEEKKLIERRPTENIAAYDLYLKARELFRTSRGSLSSDKQVTLLQAAVELDPKFYVARAHLCYAHGWLYFFNWDHTPARKAKARVAMEEAVRIAPDSPESMRAVADYSYYCLWDYRRAEEQYRAIIQRQPNYSDAYQLLSAVCRRQGKWLESIAASRKVLELDPGNRATARRLSAALEGARRYAEARLLRQQILHAQPESIAARYYVARIAFLETGSIAEISAVFADLRPEHENSAAANAVRRRWAYVTGNLAELLVLEEKRDELGLADEDAELMTSVVGVGSSLMTGPVVLMANGRKAEVEARLTRVVDLRAQVEAQPENRFWRVDLAVTEAFLGNKEAALRHIRRAVELGPKAIDLDTTVNLNLAFVLAWTGDKDAAIAEYARLLRQPAAFLNVHEMQRDPRYQPLRGDPRFEALLKDPKNHQPLF